MSPTPEQIAAMEARGWTWSPEAGSFSARGPAFEESHEVSLRVWWWSGRNWVADYGWTGYSFSGYRKHPDPLAAADEAEAWLRGALAGFRFPWLTVTTP